MKKGVFGFLFVLVLAVGLVGVVSGAWSGTNCVNTQPKIEWNINYNSGTEQFTVNYSSTYCIEDTSVLVAKSGDSGYGTCNPNAKDMAFHNCLVYLCDSERDCTIASGYPEKFYKCVGDIAICCGGKTTFSECQNMVNNNWNYGGQEGVYDITGCNPLINPSSFSETVQDFSNSVALTECAGGEGYKRNEKVVQINREDMSGKIISVYSHRTGKNNYWPRTRTTRIGVTKLPDCAYNSATGLFSGDCCTDSRVTGVPCVAVPACGDGNLDAGEGCDDGNLLDGDGCNSSCGIEVAGDIYWADADGNYITHSEVGDVVKMIVKDTWLGGNTIVNITVEESGDDVVEIEGVVNSEGDLVGVWRILGAQYDLTSDHDDYVFTVTIGLDDKTSEAIVIAEDGSDSPMRLKIMEPLCGENLTLNQARNIVVNVSDIDDIVTGTLSIDGVSWNVTNGIFTFPHTFNEAGNMKLTLTGTNTRGQTKTAISNIMVVDTSKYGVYIAACIDKPEDYEDIKESTVVFNATSTRAFQYFVGGTYSEFARSDMTFMWTFSDGRTNPNTDGTNPLAYLFHKTFTRAGDNWAELRVEVSL